MSARAYARCWWWVAPSRPRAFTPALHRGFGAASGQGIATGIFRFGIRPIR
jgi:hypothetical protein